MRPAALITPADEVTTFVLFAAVALAIGTEVEIVPEGTEDTVDDIIEELEGTVAVAAEVALLLVAEVSPPDVVEVVFVLVALASSPGISSRSSNASVNSNILKSSPMSRKSPSPIPRSPSSCPTSLSRPSKSSDETLGPSPPEDVVRVCVAV